MGWVKRRGILVHEGTFSEPHEDELRPYGYTGPKTPPACGTEAAYRRHHRNNETPCDPCIVAKVESRRRERAAA